MSRTLSWIYPYRKKQFLHPTATTDDPTQMPVPPHHTSTPPMLITTLSPQVGLIIPSVKSTYTVPLPLNKLKAIQGIWVLLALVPHPSMNTRISPLPTMAIHPTITLPSHCPCLPTRHREPGTPVAVPVAHQGPHPSSKDPTATDPYDSFNDLLERVPPLKSLTPSVLPLTP
eukprot:755899-Hanusia_phi.AAC.1